MAIAGAFKSAGTAVFQIDTEVLSGDVPEEAREEAVERAGESAGTEPRTKKLVKRTAV